MIYKLYTDGATSNNGYDNARGGYAYAIVANDKLIHADYQLIVPATNNICELMAIITGCENILSSMEIDDVVLVYSDSAYCMNCYKQQWYKKWQTNGWKNSKKEPVANKELWEKLIPFFESPNFKFEKVKGHSAGTTENEKWNNYVDKLAVRAREG